MALGIIIYAGHFYILSPGNASRQDNAKTWILSALFGLLLLLGSYAILYTINPDLTKLHSLTSLLNKPVELSATSAPKTAADLGQQIANLYNWALRIGGLVGLAVLIFGGLIYATSAGNASRQDEAKNWLLGAVIGLLLLFSPFVILRTINPDLLTLRGLMLSQNKAVESVSSPSPQAQPPPELEEGHISKIITKQLGRKSLDETGLFESWNCGGGQYAQCNVILKNCLELEKHGAICQEDVFIPIFGLIQPPIGLTKVPLSTRFLAVFHVGFFLPSDKPPVIGGNCETPLNSTLVDDIAALKGSEGLKQCFAKTQHSCYIKPETSVCISKSVDNNDNHPVQSHLELRAIDLILNDESIKDGNAKNREILELLGKRQCVANLIAPSRFNQPGEKKLCRTNGQPSECAGIKGLGGQEEQLIHYDVMPNCKP